ncbi:hypothetical protein [Marinibactrum halimedae]|uniref:GLUG domain-containing protein n=1 Tax=Marinibactrum halimedae TaxID=1444977 RepID=A0AA37TC00_9GAMM|nr:hypothetical protein [Marinibactrum halimedae]MCD9460423.1 hypothetical protein [Marinibactrum halimedae]GLS27446.1 hypothetical protein GCM10007877_31650 [Marinibactrum halimedae]
MFISVKKRTLSFLKFIFVVASFVFLSGLVYASHSNLTVDSDGDGLIEIATLEQLDWMRNDMLGTALVDFSGNRYQQGCPSSGCFGYELVADLSFDTNNDGIISSEDDYYDYDGDGSNNGWLPIGTQDNGFQASFEGNGHRISGLYIHRKSDDVETQGKNIGLLGVVTTIGESGEIVMGGDIHRFIRNLSVSTDDKGVSGETNVGALIGKVDLKGSFYLNRVAIQLDELDLMTVVNGGLNTGGVIGEITIDPWYVARNYVSITRSRINVSVTSELDNAAGIIGSIRNDHALLVQINNNDIDVTASGGGIVGGMIGYFYDFNSEGGRVEIRDNIVNVDLEAGFSAGGIVGEGLGFAASLKLNNNQVMGSVLARGGSSGGLVGWSFMVEGFFSAVNNRIFTDVHSRGSCSGGIIGGHFAEGAYLHTQWQENISYGSISGHSATGGIAGCYNAVGIEPVPAVIEKNIAIGDVRGGKTGVGGLIGRFFVENILHTRIQNNMVAGKVIGEEYIGGFIGRFISESFITNDALLNNLSLTAVRTNTATLGKKVGGFFGSLMWRDDLSPPEAFFSGNYHFNQRGVFPGIGEMDGPAAITEQSVFGARYVDLKYPQSPNAVCNVGVLYEDWDETIWDFGNSDQFPGLILGDTVYRYNKSTKVLEEEPL